MSEISNPYLAHLNTNSNNNKNYNNSSSHRIHLNVGKKLKNDNSLKAKSAFSLNKSYHPYSNNSNNNNFNNKSLNFQDNNFNNNKKNSNKFIYGNYEHYYGYRNKSSIPIDPRIELFEEEWFKHKKCLDVGCNSGFLTVSLALLFEPRLIEGVDIDPNLIKKAQNYLIFRNSLIKRKTSIKADTIRKNNKKLLKEEKKENDSDELLFDYYPISCPLTIGSIPILLNNNSQINLEEEREKKEEENIEKEEEKVKEKEKENNNNNNNNSQMNIDNENVSQDPMKFEDTLDTKDISINEKQNNSKPNKNSEMIIKKHLFPNNVYFRVSDWVNEPSIEEQKNSYDIILGLSITKWIHLNWCDYGIKRFFNKVYESLNDNGLFILEPQPFSGYSKKAKNNKKMQTNINNIELYPEQFHQYLMETVGFKSYELLGKGSNLSKGFQRNIYLYRK